MNQYQLQESKCVRCPDPLSLTDAVFLTTRFDTGTVPSVVHKNCRKKYEKEQAKAHAHDHDHDEND